jgi:hypothetical protein
VADHRRDSSGGGAAHPVPLAPQEEARRGDRGAREGEQVAAKVAERTILRASRSSHLLPDSVPLRKVFICRRIILSSKYALLFPRELQVPISPDKLGGDGFKLTDLYLFIARYQKHDPFQK